VGILNCDLTEFEEMCCQSLPPRKARFVFDGITHLMDTVFSNGVRMLKGVNMNGVKKLVSNVEAIQQNLIGFSSAEDCHLAQTKKYFELLKMNGNQIFEFINENKGLFSYDQYKLVVELKFKGEEKAWILKSLDNYFISNKK
jgi:exocyst complex component 4